MKTLLPGETLEFPEVAGPSVTVPEILSALRTANQLL